MGIAALYNVPGDTLELGQWAFDHAANHRDINRVIFQTTGQQLPEYVLDPINPADMATWEYHHQQMHNAQNSILGIAGQDLTGVDWTDAQALADWIIQNANEHLQASQRLGI